MSDNAKLNPLTEKVVKDGDIDSEGQGRLLLLQRIEALEKALHRKERENEVEKALQTPLVTINSTGILNGNNERNKLSKEDKRRGNTAESDTEEDEDREDSDEVERGISDDDDDTEEEGEERENEEEERMTAIRNQLHRTRDAWHADQGTSSRQVHGTGSIRSDAPPAAIKSAGTDSRNNPKLNSSTGSRRENSTMKSKHGDEVKDKVRNMLTKDSVSATNPAPKGKKKKEAGEGPISDIRHLGGSQTQDLYSAQLARLMSMAEEVISRK